MYYYSTRARELSTLKKYKNNLLPPWQENYLRYSILRMLVCVRSVSFWTQFQYAVSFRAFYLTDLFYLHSSFAWFIGFYLALSSLLKYLFPDWNKIISLVPPLTNICRLPSVGFTCTSECPLSFRFCSKLHKSYPCTSFLFALAVFSAFLWPLLWISSNPFHCPSFNPRVHLPAACRVPTGNSSTPHCPAHGFFVNRCNRF